MGGEIGIESTTDTGAIFKMLDQLHEQAINIRDTAFSLHLPADEAAKESCEPEPPSPSAIGQRIIQQLQGIKRILKDAQASQRGFG